MKKIIFVLLLVSALVMCGCQGNQPSIPDDTSAADVTTAAPVTTTEPAQTSQTPETTVPEPVTTVSEDELYKDIVCQTSEKYVNSLFSYKNSNFTVCYYLPDEWVLTPASDENGYTLERDSTVFGKLISGEVSDTEAWTPVATREKARNGLSTTEYIERSGTGDTLKFRYRYLYSFEESGTTRTLTLVADYDQVCSQTADHLLGRSDLTDTTSRTQFNTLASAKDSSILILGNSFIGSSDIGNILNEMFVNNQRRCKVNAISRGYAEVDTYVNDTELMSSILNGAYDAVFICGLYSGDQLTPLQALSGICQRSNTRLVIFPAHNEPTAVINAAMKNNPGLVCLNWKNEIDSLIATGLSRWIFCVDDTYDHSKPLAGYVGAHMIYRAIYGEVPRADMKRSITQTEIDAHIKNYADTANISDSIRYFN